MKETKSKFYKFINKRTEENVKGVILFLITMPIFIIPDYIRVTFALFFKKDQNVIINIIIGIFSLIFYPILYVLKPFYIIIKLLFKIEDKGKGETLIESKLENSDNVFVCPVNEKSTIVIFNNKDFESVWAKENRNNKYSLFIKILTNEDSIGLGNSTKNVFYYCKLLGLIKTGGEYENGLAKGVYQFNIVDYPQGEFAHKNSKEHIGKNIYIDRDLFEVHFVIPVFSEDLYDKELKNTIGLEEIDFN